MTKREHIPRPQAEEVSMFSYPNEEQMRRNEREMSKDMEATAKRNRKILGDMNPYPFGSIEYIREHKRRTRRR